MSLKQFNADVRAVRSRIEDDGIPGVFDIERGGSDGEVVVTFAHEKLPAPIFIRLLAKSLENYPDGNSFLISTASDDVPITAISALNTIRDYASGMRLLESITALSTHLDHALHSGDRGQHSIINDLSDPGDSDELMSDDLYGDFNDPDFGLSFRQADSQSFPRSSLAADVLQRVKLDLRAAWDAGCKVGILEGLQNSSEAHIFSLSICASQLGISHDALEAWDVSTSDHIILMVRIEGLYPCAQRLYETACASFNVSFRFGKGAKYRPSPAQARAAFQIESSRTRGTSEVEAQADEDDQGWAFDRIFISNSLEQFMNEQCLPMVKLRFQNPAYSWDDANEQFQNLFSSSRGDGTIAKANNDEQATGSQSKPTKKAKSIRRSKGKQRETAGKSASKAVEHIPSYKPIPNFLMQDAAAIRPLEQCSTPLIFMQFAVHYFSRCTEYCLRCHRHIDTEFEALKPFVCSNPLCLFQYLAMGFGPSIEHEILTQPYVVDLLISLCYSSVSTSIPDYRYASISALKHSIREFPCGLHLKVPHPFSATAASNTPLAHSDSLGPIAYASAITTPSNSANTVPSAPIKVWADLQNREVTVSSEYLGRIIPDMWVSLVEGGRVHHMRVKYVDHQTRTVKVDLPIIGSPGPDGPAEMGLHLHDTDFDDLDDAGKASSIITILKSLPAVSSLREYLINNPHSKLRSYAGTLPAAVTLLEWIVASNRSCILQVTPVEDRHARDRSLLKTIKTRDQEAIPSLKGLVQFRFAQGAPDKELRFRRALKEARLENSDHPTLFAWHGSALSNWHSILRHGLDFKDTANGRVHGNGVYFARQYNISQSYAHPACQNAPSHWQNSALDISRVISLCEIVNDPAHFVSSNPYYVIGNVDWIQCRYLFAQRATIPESAADPGSATDPGNSRYWAASECDATDDIPDELALIQDPHRIVEGPDGKALRIPLKAVPTRKQQKPQTPSSSKRAYEAMCSAGETDEERVSDLEFLFGDDKDMILPHHAKRSSLGRDSSVDSMTAREITTQRPPTPQQTDFRVGTLDLSSLPRLPLPVWADGNSTRRLAGEIKHMQKVQANTPPHELGWYIDFDSMENMFQWIVEFHSFDHELPLAKDMKKAGVTSIVLEVRFGRNYPYSPPFVRVVRPRFLPFSSGGGGHITIGGAICMELLTASGWRPVMRMDTVFVLIRMAMSETERPAHLQTTETSAGMFEYGAREALEAYLRFAHVHGWTVPKDLRETATQAAQ